MQDANEPDKRALKWMASTLFFSNVKMKLALAVFVFHYLLTIGSEIKRQQRNFGNYLFIYQATYPFIHPSIHPSITRRNEIRAGHIIRKDDTHNLGAVYMEVGRS